MTAFSWLFRARPEHKSTRTRARRPVRGPTLRVETLEDRLLLSATSLAANSISGFVYNDTNNNGVMDSGEHGIANTPISLYDANGKLVASTVTDANGAYSFATDPRVSTAPTTQNYTATFNSLPTNWTQQQTVAQFNPALGTLVSVQIEDNATITSDIKVENLDSAAQTINANVQGSQTLSGPGVSQLTTNLSATQSDNAAAFDGSIDFSGASGHDFGAQTANGSKSVTLTDATSLAEYTGTGTITLSDTAQGTSTVTGSANVVSQINTTAAAQVTVIYTYIPNNGLGAGNYTVVEVTPPSGYLPGQSTSGNVTPMPHSVGNTSIPVTLVNGTPSTNNNFASVQPSTVAGYVYLDSNDNGVKDPSESGIASATVNLTGTNDLGATVNLTTTTAVDGSYSFSSLRPGDYSLQEVAPSGYLAGKDSVGTQGGTLGNLAINNFVITPGAQGANNNFGHVQAASLSGYVYSDANNNGSMDPGEFGIAGVAVKLTGTDDLGNAVSQSAVTAADGSYNFQNLRPGTYTIVKVPPSGYLEGKDAVGSLGGTGTVQDQLAGIAAGSGAVGTGYNFGELTPGSLSGYVYLDKAKRGVRVSGDPGIKGTTIILTGVDNMGNAVHEVQTTLADGSYSFNNLRPGTYTIQEVQPTGYLPGKADIGTQGGTVGSGQLTNIQLAAGIAGTDNDFGETLPPLPVVPPSTPPPVLPPVVPPPPLSKQILIFFFG